MTSCVGKTVGEIVRGEMSGIDYLRACNITRDALAGIRFLNDHGGSGYTVKFESLDVNSGLWYLDVTTADSKDLWKVYNYARIHWGGGIGLIFGPGRTHRLRIDGRHESSLAWPKLVYILYDDGKNKKFIKDSDREFAAYYARAKAEYLSEQAQDPVEPIINVDDVTSVYNGIQSLGIIAAVIVLGVLGLQVLARIPKSGGKAPGPQVKRRARNDDAE